MGTAAWMTMIIIGGPQDLALGVAILIAFFSESIIQSNIRKQLKQRARILQTAVKLWLNSNAGIQLALLRLENY